MPILRILRRTLGQTLGRIVAFSLVAGGLLGCARAPLSRPQEAMRRTSAPALGDDLPLEPLRAALEAEIRFFEAPLPTGAPPPPDLVFGTERFTRAEYATGLKRFVTILGTIPDRGRLYDAIREEFDFLEVYGPETKGSWGDIFMTSYYEPVLSGSLKRTTRFTQPLYRAPNELMTLDLSAFDTKYQNDRKLRGRLDGKAFVPYFSREQIDSKGALKGRRLELCWVDPVDAFFLQIQGSGVVELPGGKKLHVNFADKNGHPYEPLGKFLKDVIPIDKLNLQTIEAHVRTLPADKLQTLLNRNPSYVFFETKPERAVTSLGLPATAGRTIATDGRWFPKGGLAFLSFDQPILPADPALPPSGETERVSRFVLDQDVGGAITGGGRVDLFWGSGPEAKRYAGLMKARGRLYYLIPKRRSLP